MGETFLTSMHLPTEDVIKAGLEKRKSRGQCKRDGELRPGLKRKGRERASTFSAHASTSAGLSDTRRRRTLTRNRS